MPHEQAQDQVPINIDRKPFKSPNPTTGAALYLLGSVAADYDLFEEVHGHGDDLLIANDATQVTIKAGEHFYSAQRKLNPGAGE